MRLKIIKKLKITLIILFSFIFLFVALYAGGMIYLKIKLSKIHTVSITKDPGELGIKSDIFDTKKNADTTTDSGITSTTSAEALENQGSSKIPIPSTTGIINILLLGTDTRDPAASMGYSDSIMILTFDKRHNQIKLTSIMRDTYVSIDGHGKQKLSVTHKIGGPLLTLKTINENFDMNIKDYVEVNFFGFEKIIDYLGGVPINITKEEIPVANDYITTLSRLEKISPDYIKNPGLQTLTGIQALGYSRIRYVGRADFQRTDRQRTVLGAMAQKMAHSGVSKIPGILDIVAPNITTSVSSDRIINYAKYAITHGMTHIQQSRIPYDGLYSDHTIRSQTGTVNEVLVYDKEKNVEKLHKFIFG